MRNGNWDQPKSLAQIKKERGQICSVPGCGKPLTHMKGPGSGVLCREHQLGQREYGGMGRVDRLHTFHRKDYCEECGYNPADETERKYPGLRERDPMLFSRLVRNKLIGDHQNRKSDGGEDTAENIKTLCLNCNADKTILNEDYKPGRLTKPAE